MQHNFRQFTHKIAIAMIAVVLLQFAGGNMGEHQLHLGSHDEEPANHPHLQFTAQVTTLALEQCTACNDLSYSDSEHANQTAAHTNSCDSSFADGELISNDYLASNLGFSFEAASLYEELPSATEIHSHQISKTETKLFDLCLDCQCHGGHATVMTSGTSEPSVPLSDEFVAMVSNYLPPESLPDYRPPIV
ncbi:hypothetical protein MK852_09545 [Shewanella benthica]|uniref:hypothetical protein n=1 Tax=Shewanella benthica TaxID=43661 RepID=UPI001D0D01D2|nr:hypothetical protein [Shewanella benthica]MCL1062381.1 hypothetical protein [Shewanella benthica]